MKKIIMMFMCLCLFVGISGCGSNDGWTTIESKEKQKEAFAMISKGFEKLSELDSVKRVTQLKTYYPSCDEEKVKISVSEEKVEKSIMVQKNQYISKENQTIDGKNIQTVRQKKNDGNVEFFILADDKPIARSLQVYEDDRTEKDFLLSLTDWEEIDMNTYEKILMRKDGDNTVIRAFSDIKKMNENYENDDEAKSVQQGACTLDSVSYVEQYSDFTINKDGYLISSEYHIKKKFNEEEKNSETKMIYKDFNKLKSLAFYDVKKEEEKVVEVPVYTKDQYQQIGDPYPDHKVWCADFVILANDKLKGGLSLEYTEEGFAMDILETDINPLCSGDDQIGLYPEQNVCNFDGYFYKVRLNAKEQRVITVDDVTKYIHELLRNDDLESIEGIFQISKTYSDMISLFTE
ncbi:MAG: hypothetical protein PHQ89_04970 [Bacilli bacterium]|nr:hypothetical protein [Bacilli bacterium]